MARFMAPIAAATIAILSVGAANAQSMPSMPGMSSSGGGMLSSMTGGMTGGASSLLGGSVPGLSSASTGNVAGVLSYCAQNNLLQQGGSAASALTGLTQKPGVTTSSGYSSGQQGLLQSGTGSTFSIASLKGQMKTKACNLVLNKAQSIL